MRNPFYLTLAILTVLAPQSALASNIITQCPPGQHLEIQQTDRLRSLQSYVANASKQRDALRAKQGEANQQAKAALQAGTEEETGDIPLSPQDKALTANLNQVGAMYADEQIQNLRCVQNY